MTVVFYIGLAILLGVFPPILWLWFWLKEDPHPEPRREIIYVFLAGMLGVIAALVFEHLFGRANFFVKEWFGYGAVIFQLLNIFGFALIEELTKTGAAFFTAFKSPYVDEPVDGMVYMVTAAMGFAALENILFIDDSLRTIGVNHSIIVSAFRFMNAVLIHAAASAIIGAGFAFSFYHRKRRVKEVVFALFMATVLHALYNLFILGSAISVINQLIATTLVGVGAVTALMLFEKARAVNNLPPPNVL
jgi:protease PrsW